VPPSGVGLGREVRAGWTAGTVLRDWKFGSVGRREPRPRGPEGGPVAGFIVVCWEGEGPSGIGWPFGAKRWLRGYVVAVLLLLGRNPCGPANDGAAVAEAGPGCGKDPPRGPAGVLKSLVISAVSRPAPMLPPPLPAKLAGGPPAAAPPLPPPRKGGPPKPPRKSPRNPPRPRGAPKSPLGAPCGAGIAPRGPDGGAAGAR